MLSGASKLNGKLRKEVKSFFYEPSKTEWDFDASKHLLGVMVSTLGHSRKEIAEFGGENLPVVRLSEIANSEDERGFFVR